METVKKIFWVILSVALIFPALACLNEYTKDIHGKDILNNYEASLKCLEELTTVEKQEKLKRNTIIDKNKTKKLIDKLEEELKEVSGIRLKDVKEFLKNEKSNYAVHLLRLGVIDSAFTILEQLYVEYPEEYNVIANLGTACELAGQDVRALDLLTKAVAIKPQSHDGSEWIHLKVLEAKIALKTNPLWLQQNPILGFDFGAEALPKKNSEVKNEEQFYIIDQLEIQLKERMYFIKPKDVIVGDLLMLLGDMYGLHIGVNYALSAYQLAEKYTVSKPILLEKRLNEAIKVQEQKIIKIIKENIEKVIVGEKQSSTPQKSYFQYYVISAIGIFSIVVLAYVLRKKNKAHTIL